MTVDEILSYVEQLDAPHGYVNTDKHEPGLKLFAGELDRVRMENKWHRMRSSILDAVLDGLDDVSPASAQVIRQALECWEAVHPKTGEH